MKTIRTLSSICLTLALAAGGAMAQGPQSGKLGASEALQTIALDAKLKEMYPNRQFGPISSTQIPGLFEVATGDTLSYVDSTGTYFLFGGQLVDFKQQINITEKRLGELNKIDAASLPLGDAIKVVKGNGKRVLVVFADPNCAFCKKLEGDLQGVDNVTIYTFLYPILTNSKDKAAHVWCAVDRAKTWDDLMVRGTQPFPNACDNPVDRNLALGQRLRVTGTPTMFSADGRRLAGAVGLAGVNAFLDASAKVASK